MAPLPSNMSSVQGPLSQEGEEQKREKSDTEEPESPDRTAKGCKSKAFSLPFSVESLISDRVTSRTAYTTPTSPSEEPSQISPMSLYTDRKVPLENLKRDAEDHTDKGQTGWFQTPTYTSPPSK